MSAARYHRLVMLSMHCLNYSIEVDGFRYVHV